MATYEVTAWCSVPYYTTFEVEAATMDEALRKAKRQVERECGEPCGGGESEWDEFEIVCGDASLSHLEPPRLAANAAPELLEALNECVAHLPERSRSPYKQGAVNAYHMARAAIAKATHSQE